MSESVENEGELTAEVETEAGEGAASSAQTLDADPSNAVVARREMEELNDRHLRLVAEYSNYRRRNDQERLSAWGRAQAEVIAKFLDVLDDLHRVAELDLGNASVEGIMEGIDLVERKFSRMLVDAGVEVIDPAGERFDPQRMEALMRVPAPSPDQDETVAQVMQKGYALKGTLMRPARVAVYKQG
ncbi:MAG: nucleotide exchange factor GrpE [Longimicrobiales bacterium]